jgi:hypothetical protein
VSPVSSAEGPIGQLHWRSGQWEVIREAVFVVPFLAVQARACRFVWVALLMMAAPLPAAGQAAKTAIF